MRFRMSKKVLKALTATGSAGVLLSAQVCPVLYEHEQALPHAAHPDHAPVPTTTTVELLVVTTATTSFR